MAVRTAVSLLMLLLLLQGEHATKDGFEVANQDMPRT